GSDNAPTPSSETKIKGTVKWFDARRGFGFIIPEDGSADVFVHHSDIHDPTNYKILQDGEEVEFEAITEPNKQRLRAVRVTWPGGAYVKGSNRLKYVGTPEDFDWKHTHT
ncbi:hypothetical protein ACHAWF_001346, partial [Thalassiosira exigua]